MSLNDFNLNRNFKFNRVVYAAPNLNYSKINKLQKYFEFDNPDPEYKTDRKVDLSQVNSKNFRQIISQSFSQISNQVFKIIDPEFDWPFRDNKVPINGILCIPEKKLEPLPVAVFTHGYRPEADKNSIPSTPGFLYLCDLLASQGVLAATIDANFFNGNTENEVYARAILILEHLKQLHIWNNQQGHPLQDKLNLNKCMIVGHSFGGEAVGHASMLNQLKYFPLSDKQNLDIPLDGSLSLGPYGFGIQAVIALAPTYQQYRLPRFSTQVLDNYLVIHGSRDESVKSFEGQLTYDEAHKIYEKDLNSENQRNLEQALQDQFKQMLQNNKILRFKSLLWIHKANHNYFNSEWEQESAGVITREEQEKITKTYVLALAKALLFDEREYLNLLQDHAFGQHKYKWLPQDITFVSQYRSTRRQIIQDFNETEDIPRISSKYGIVGSVAFQGIKCQVKNLFKVEKPSFLERAKELIGKVNPLNRQTSTVNENDFKDVYHHLYQDNRGLQIDWTELNGSYTLNLEPDTLKTEEFDSLVFYIGQSYEENNPDDKNQDFTITVHNRNRSSSWLISSLQSLPYPDVFPLAKITSDKRDPLTVLQSVFLPFQQLYKQGIDPRKITCLEFIFNQVRSGTIYISGIEFTQRF